MSDCGQELTWAGGTHRFDLNHPWVRNVLNVRGLPGDNGTSPAACLRRFEEGSYTENDVARVLELGLIGGGLSRTDAARLVNEHVRNSPIMPSAIVAFAVLQSLFLGKVTADGSTSA